MNIPINHIESKRVCICDCNTGRYISTFTKMQIEYLYELVKTTNIKKNGDYVPNDVAVEGAIDTVTEIKEYLAEQEDGG